ncbi:MAG TPA: EAL domain-containing protein [Xanthobacteraceae bacterium]|jgi:EAL domain-containing protein (putative c-di-GMP-specific phosphodiesterase class I)
MGLLEAPAPAPCPAIEVDEALNNGWFEDWYQPKIDLKRKCLAGAEALACIRHPGLGLLMPGGYSCGTSAGLARLSEHALRALLVNWSSFDAAGFNLNLAIKLPVRMLLELPIRELVAQHRPASERWPGVILQVNEDDIVRDLKLAREVTNGLRASGVKIAIDDFGAGYSSLASLRELSFVEIKLDGSFVQSCATDATNGAICQTAIDLAHRFSSSAAAKGIESPADLQALIAMGCDFGQGDLISPPMSHEHFLGLLRQRSKPRPQESDVSAAPAAPVGPIDRVA